MVRCSSGKIGSNRRSCPKKDIVSMFDGLFFVDQNFQTLVLIPRFSFALLILWTTKTLSKTEGHVDQEGW